MILRYCLLADIPDVAVGVGEDVARILQHPLAHLDAAVQLLKVAYYVPGDAPTPLTVDRVDQSHESDECHCACEKNQIIYSIYHSRYNLIKNIFCIGIVDGHGRTVDEFFS